MNFPLVPFFSLYQNKSQKTGDTYLIGYLGEAKIVVFRNKEAKEGEPQWKAFIQERPPKSEAQAAAPKREPAPKPVNNDPFFSDPLP